MEFKSQICTDINQSRKLLELGLKKETADMSWFRRSTNADFECCTSSYTEWVEEILPIVDDYTLKDIIPAWSLHRLVEMIPFTIWHTEHENCPRLKHTFWFCKYAPNYNSNENIDFRAHPNLYDNIIDCIEWLINEGYFNKDYLEEK